MERRTTPHGAKVVEVLDNGAMVKRLERYADAERLYHDRPDPEKQ